MQEFKFMSHALKVVCHAVLGSVFLSSSVLAADMGAGGMSRMPVERAPMMDIEEWGSNWYLRGNIGYATNQDASISRNGVAFTEFDMDGALSVGAGFGFKKDWFRMDITGDWFANANFDARGPVANVGTTAVTGDAGAFAVLANAYIDLGTWSGITPYVGAGIGTSYVTILDYRRAGAATSAGLADDPRWNFSWALMAGVGIEVMRNLNLDVGYRYINFGDGKTGVDALNAPILFKDWSAHEFRVGARLMID